MNFNVNKLDIDITKGYNNVFSNKDNTFLLSDVKNKIYTTSNTLITFITIGFLNCVFKVFSIDINFDYIF